MLDTRYALRDHYTRQTTATGECPTPDTRYTVRHTNARNILAIIKSPFGNGGYGQVFMPIGHHNALFGSRADSRYGIRGVVAV